MAARTRDPATLDELQGGRLSLVRLQEDFFREWPPGHPDAPAGIVGMTVSEAAHGNRPQPTQPGQPRPPLIEFMAIGTAVAPLWPNDPRRAPAPPKPRIVVPLDR